MALRQRQTRRETGTQSLGVSYREDRLATEQRGKMRQRTHPLAPDRSRDPTATTMSRRSFLATASAKAAGVAIRAGGAGSSGPFDRCTLALAFPTACVIMIEPVCNTRTART